MLPTLPRPGSGLQTLPGTGPALPCLLAGGPDPDPAVFADAVARYRVLERLRGFRQALYGCLDARADALFELADAVLCADHAVTSVVQPSLEPEFTRGHGALYDALAAGRIDDERFFCLLAAGLPQAVDGPDARAWIAEHDVIDRGTLNLMGDPEMPVWLGPPATMIVTFPAILDKRQPFTVTVQPSVPLPPVLPPYSFAVHIQQGTFSRLAYTNAAGVAVFDLNPAELGKLDITVTRLGFKPFIGSARIAGPAWVSGSVTQIIHQQGSPHRSYVRLHLSTAIDGDTDRGWYAQDQLPDYGIIMDAVTDAYVQDKAISLFVNLTDQGGTIERFAFGLVVLDGLEFQPIEIPAAAAPITIMAPAPASTTSVEDKAVEGAVAGTAAGQLGGGVDLQATADQDGQKVGP